MPRKKPEQFATNEQYDRHIEAHGGTGTARGRFERAMSGERPSARAEREAREKASAHASMLRQSEATIERTHASTASPPHVKAGILAHERYKAATHAARAGDLHRAEHHLAQGDSHAREDWHKEERPRAIGAMNQHRDARGRFA